MLLKVETKCDDNYHTPHSRFIINRTEVGSQLRSSRQSPSDGNINGSKNKVKSHVKKGILYKKPQNNY